MGKKTDEPKGKGKKPSTAKGGKAKGQEVKDLNTSKEITPGSETPITVDEVNLIEAPQGASVTNANIEMSPASAETNPLEANLTQLELQNNPPTAGTEQYKQYEIGNSCHMFPAFAKFQLIPTVGDFDRLRLEYTASCRRSMIREALQLQQTCWPLKERRTQTSMLIALKSQMSASE